MLSFCKRAFAAQDVCGCQPVGINLEAQEDLCLGQRRLQGQWELEVGAQPPGVQEGLEHQGSHGLVLTPVTHLQTPSRSLWVVPVPKPMPCPKPSDSGCTGGSRGLPNFSLSPSHIQSLFPLPTNSVFQFQGEKSTPKSSDCSWPCQSVSSLEEAPAVCWAVLQAGGVCSCCFVPASALAFCEMKRRRAWGTLTAISSGRTFVGMNFNDGGVWGAWTLHQLPVYQTAAAEKSHYNKPLFTAGTDQDNIWDE